MQQTDYLGFSDDLRRVLSHLPPLQAILESGLAIEDMRQGVEQYLLTRMVRPTDPTSQSPLEWVLRRESTHLLSGFILPRNESASGFSLMTYLHALCSRTWKTEYESLPEPSKGFLRELEHLVRGVAGTTDVYDHAAGLHTPVSDSDLSHMRSDELNRIAARAQEEAGKVANGLDKDVVRRRGRNRIRIMNALGVSDVEWNDWKWQLRHAIRDEVTLGRLIRLRPEEEQAIRMAREKRLPFAITPYYVSLMDRSSGGRGDRAVRAQVIPSLNYVERTLQEMSDGQGCMDFMLEKDTSPIEGITRRYPMVCILKPILTCPQICVYCQRNWQITDPDSDLAVLSAEKLDAAVRWIRDTPEINEVLVTGGDPLMLSGPRIRAILSRLSRIDHVKRIRIGTRTPVTLPQRITESLVRAIAQYHVPGQREVVIVTHFEHPYEVTHEAMEAVQRFRRFGMEVYNQMVFTFYNSHRFEACSLRNLLRLIGVTPYYTFNTKGKEETADFRVPIARLLQEQKEELRLFPGTVRTDEVVFNVPRLGKNYLRAGQHHEIIAILPDGRRVYEFHPWEKKMSPVGTYIYTDVAIGDYLDRLREDGDDVHDYRTIWYYY